MHELAMKHVSTWHAGWDYSQEFRHKSCLHTVMLAAATTGAVPLLCFWRSPLGKLPLPCHCSFSHVISSAGSGEAAKPSQPCIALTPGLV
jgi:hypothetical protein